MAATASDLAKAIQPGSIPQGQRAPLEAGLGQAVGGGTAPDPSVAAGAVAAPPGGPNDPIAALLGGGVKPGGDTLPLTDGLSVGPGAVPPSQAEDPRIVKLQQIATQASSPVLRALARNGLRLMVGEGL